MSALTRLLQHSPDELSSGVLISEWIQSKEFPSSFEFDLSQIEPTPKDSVTKYLNWVCLNAKVFNNFGILLNSSQINNFIEGKSTEIYIILKQLHDKIRERNQQRSCIKSTKSAPSPSIPHIPILKESTTAIGLQRRSNFPSLSLEISPTISHDQIEKITTTTTTNIGTIKEHEPYNVDTLSLLSPDLNQIKETKFRLKEQNIAFQQFEDHIIYFGIKLFGENKEFFLDERNKLSDKLNEAMSSYQNNNAQYLNNIVEQYRMQKLKICQGMSDELEQNKFREKLENDLHILDKSLKQQFEESKNTLYNQLSAIHQNRLKEFAIKLNEKSASIELQTSINVNNQNINIPKQDQEEDELNVALKEISSLLQKCWKKEMRKQKKQKSDKEKEITTLKEILSIYQNLSNLIQLQSNTLKTTIIDFENLCHHNYNQESTQNSSPDKMKIPYDYSKYYEMPNNTQIQLLSSSETQNYTNNEDHIMVLKSTNNGRKKRRKSFNKKSVKNTCKTPAFSFIDPKYNRQTVSSKNKKVGSKKKLKKNKKNM